MNKYCAIYARQSIDKSDSISIETQIERCRWETGDQPFQVYYDRGFSGKNTARPQFQAMLREIREGKVSCVICYKLDRCSRSIVDFTQLMELFQQYGVSFISCTEKFDTGTPMGRAMLNICIVFAQLERETIQQRITDAYHSRCTKGYFMGGRIPFGFKLVPCLLDGKRTSRYEMLENETEILRQIYALYSAPTASLADVVLELRKQGTANPRRSDGLWVRSNLSRVIKNPIYVRADPQIFDHYTAADVIADNPREDYIGINGCYLYNIENEKHLVLAPHEGIIPADIWLRCQKVRCSRGNARNNTSHASWLTGKLKCGICGGAVITRQARGKNGQIYRYFICSDSRGKAGTCVGFKPFRADAVENAIQNAFLLRIKTWNRPEKPSPEQLRLDLLELAGSLPPEELIHGLQELLHRQGSGKPLADEMLTQRILMHMESWETFPQQKKSRVAALLLSRIELTERKVTLCWRL